MNVASQLSRQSLTNLAREPNPNTRQFVDQNAGSFGNQQDLQYPGHEEEVDDCDVDDSVESDRKNNKLDKRHQNNARAQEASSGLDQSQNQANARPAQQSRGSKR